MISRGLPSYQTELLRKITDETVETHAMGNKFIRVIREKAAGLVYMGSVASLWDTCAGEALIKSLGGTVTNFLGNDIVYDNKRNNFNLGSGIMCAFEKGLIQNLQENLGMLFQVTV